ncbi:MAG: MarR family winged helix-turn-helix transcriptional regulator [Anaerolineae bacterium]|nr:winged helix-turn-helix transcriptional regulator [Anaerolineae bacterium]
MSNDTDLKDWQLLAQFSQLFRGVSDGFSDEVDVHRGQAIVLCTVVKRDGMTQSEIATELSIQGATVTNMLQRMEEAGLVIRRRDPDDNRLVRVYITPEGREKELAINRQFQTMQEMLFTGMSEEERAGLRRLLGQMIQNMSVRA